MAAFVTFEDVSKVYHSGEIEIRAVDHISFTIEKGEFCVIVGPSGAGKTTVLNMLGGMDACSGGTITVDGTRVSGFNARQLTTYRRHDIGFVFQFYNLVGNLTALENVELAAQICKDPLDAATVLNEVGLSARANNFPGQLSGGEQQRVAIARALATDPKVLLCDEATSALDPNTTHAILQLIQKINRELGITVVIITHQMSVVEEVCNRVAILDNGTVVEEGEVQAIFSHPTSKAARRLVYPAGAPQAEPLPGHKLVRVAFGGTQTTDKPLVASLAIECGALVSIMAADTRIVNGQTLGTMLLALPDDDKAAAALDYIKNYPGITYEEVNG